jgi:hypothetical protein
VFEKIKAKFDAEAKEKTRELLAYLAHEIKSLINSIEAAVVNGLDKSEDLDDDLVKDIEELHEKASALEEKIKAKLAPAKANESPDAENQPVDEITSALAGGKTVEVKAGDSVQAPGVDGELPEGTKIEGEAEPEAEQS